MDKRKKIQIIIFAVLIVAALGIAIPRLITKPKGERFKIKELSQSTERHSEGESETAPGTDAASIAPGSGSTHPAGAQSAPESDHELGRNPFRELIRPSVVQPTTSGGASESPFAAGSLGGGPMWPDQSTTLEPFSPGGLPGFASGAGQDGPREPVYTLTGIVSGENSVAVLRTTEERMYVRPGDVLDDGSRVASVYRDRVVLNRSDGQVILVLGGSNDDGSIELDAGQNRN